MHYGWGVGISLFFLAISGVVLSDHGLTCPFGFPGCTCDPPYLPLRPTIIRCVNTTRSDLPKVRVYDYTTRLQLLDLTGSRIKELKPMMLSSGYGNLMALILKNNLITNIDKAALDNQTSLIKLDLRNNYIKTLPRGVFSQRKLRDLKLANNPFSCDDTNLLGEIEDLMTGAAVQVFDGGMLRCAEPAHMKGRKIIDVIQGNKASAIGAGAMISLTSGIAALLTSLIGAVIILIKRRKSDSKYKYDSLSSRDEGSVQQSQKKSENVVDEEEVVAHRLQKLRRQSQGYPENDNIESEDEES